MVRQIAIILFFLLAGAAGAQEGSPAFTIGGDAFLAGQDVNFTASGTDDLFMAGETVRSQADISGSAHAAGRRVTLDAAIGRDAYAVGMDVSILGPVGGDASLAGYQIVVDGAVGGDLRASGANVRVNAPVAGYAVLAGEKVTLNSVISGDVTLGAEELNFGPDARIDGTLTVYEPVAGQVQVPETVVPGERLQRVLVEGWSESSWRAPRVFNLWHAVGSFLVGIVVVAAVAALIAAVVPEQLAAMRSRTLDAPFRSLWFGFLAESALLGSAILFAMSIVGIFLSPAMVIVAVVAGFFGYVVGAYTFGVGLLLAIGRDEPDSLGQRALAAGVGALLAGLLALVPFLGWLFVLVLTLAGIGAITTRVFRPAFFTDA